MMNKTEFTKLHKWAYDLLDYSAYRPVEGVIRWSLSESPSHFLTKCMIIRQLKRGIHPTDVEFPINIFGGFAVIPIIEPKKMGISGSKWRRPKIYTEARFSKRLRADILAVTTAGAYVIEIADTETKKEIDRKHALYNKMGLKFIEVRI